MESVSLAVKSVNGFSGIVSLSANTPASVDTSIRGLSTPSPIAILGRNDTASLSFTAHLVGNYTVTVTGSVGSLSHSVSVLVIAQNLTFSVSPNPVNISPGSQGASVNATVTLTSVNGASGHLTFYPGTSYSPILYATIFPADDFLTPGGSALVKITIYARAGAQSGTANLRVQVSGLGISADFEFPVTVS